MRYFPFITHATNLLSKYISLSCLCLIMYQSRIVPCHLCCPQQSLDGYENRFMLHNQKVVCWDLDEKGIALYYMHVFNSSKFCFVNNLWYCSECIIYYLGTLITGTKSTSIGDLLLPDRGRYGSQHHSCMRPLYHFFNFLTFFFIGVTAIG
jgi:hypothetical protein